MITQQDWEALPSAQIAGRTVLCKARTARFHPLKLWRRSASNGSCVHCKSVLRHLEFQFRMGDPLLSLHLSVVIFDLSPQHVTPRTAKCVLQAADSKRMPSVVKYGLILRKRR